MMPEIQDQKKHKKMTEKGELFRNLSNASMVGINLVACILIGFSIGYWVLDRYLNTFPWFTIIFFFLGIAAGFKHLFNFAAKQDKDDEEGTKAQRHKGTK
jgi:ATP synthase protein I